MTLRMELSDIEKEGRRKLKHEVFLTDQERSRAFQNLDQRVSSIASAIFSPGLVTSNVMSMRPATLT